MDPTALGFLFLGIVLFAGIAALSHSGSRGFSAAMIYLGLSAAAAGVVRIFGVGRLATPTTDHGLLELVTTIALALGLFATGMRIRRRPGLDGWHLSLRLILIAMPLTIAAGAAWAHSLMGLSAGAAIALGAALAPTDPVLAGDLGVEPPEEQEEEESPEPEFVLTSEAGLNDGAAMPFLLLGIAIAGHDSLWRWAGVDVVYAVAGGIVLGAALGRGIAIVASKLREREFLADDYDRWVGLAAGLGVYGAAEAVGTLGFLAAFAAGIAFRRHELEGAYRREVHDGASVMTHFAELGAILVLGSMLVVGNFGKAGWWGIGLAVVSVFVIRPVIALATLSFTKRLSTKERLWVAWFGVKGVATLNYGAAIVAATVFTAADRGAAVWTVLTAVGLSILVHGMTSDVLTPRLLSRR
jgi:NhaP-type Na+/H+ or K+/H+ antiporter